MIFKRLNIMHTDSAHVSLQYIKVCLYTDVWGRQTHFTSGCNTAKRLGSVSVGRVCHLPHTVEHLLGIFYSNLPRIARSMLQFFTGVSVVFCILLLPDFIFTAPTLELNGDTPIIHKPLVSSRSPAALQGGAGTGRKSPQIRSSLSPRSIQSPRASGLQKPRSSLPAPNNKLKPRLVIIFCFA